MQKILGQDSTDEIWLPVVGWEKYYQISSIGRVRSLERMSRVNSKNSGLRRMGGIIRKQHITSSGYRAVSLTANGVRSVELIHRLVLNAFVRLRKEGEFGRHLNDIQTDNRVENLAWGTLVDNAADRMKNKGYARAELHPVATITNEVALAIYNSEETYKSISEKYGISHANIARIKKGKIWKSVTGGVPRNRPRHRPDRIIPKNEVRKILQMRADGMLIREIAEIYGVSHYPISTIIKENKTESRCNPAV
jgi:uncharacterized protein YerC